MDSTIIKLFFELPIFQKNEVNVAKKKSFGNSNEGTMAMAFHDK